MFVILQWVLFIFQHRITRITTIKKGLSSWEACAMRKGVTLSNEELEEAQAAKENNVVLAEAMTALSYARL